MPVADPVLSVLWATSAVNEALVEARSKNTNVCPNVSGTSPFCSNVTLMANRQPEATLTGTTVRVVRNRII